jgi:hypothetical protein
MGRSYLPLFYDITKKWSMSLKVKVGNVFKREERDEREREQSSWPPFFCVCERGYGGTPTQRDFPPAGLSDIFLHRFFKIFPSLFLPLKPISR